ncbi:Protein of unknown function [Dyella jiangningensis]|uniref:DUF3613 domain-containing protein n=1 Tax=Dyella sp. AtDHG13 TaxID=1938897 RepID=UPI00088C7010|nr:DUF3613 domain-containing protein [Dyella sp. AtDHG13]PXV55341.1 uncharacterized protein DUF3613 [Dyella sp. AtDHG13]SDK80113.1 Protein of unknown function [Dyella jiangningensis]
MMLSHRRYRFALAALIACAAPLGAHAQQTPITGQMGAPASPPAATQPSAETPAAAAQPAPNADAAPADTEVGDVTRQLLVMQRQGTHAGKALPIPGQEASASYLRYLKSFEHPIPEFYEGAVSKNIGAGGNTSGTSGSP